MTSEDASGGPLDVPTLELIGRRASTHDLVTDWSFRPDEISPRRPELRLDEDQYPDDIGAVRLDLSWYEGGEYTVHYVETHDDGRWQCRWNRHPKPDAPRAHFHPPPNAGVAVEPSPVDDAHHLGVLLDVLDWIADRLAKIHGA